MMDNHEICEAWRAVFSAAFAELHSGNCLEVVDVDANGNTRMNPAINAMKQASAEIRALEGKQEIQPKKSAEVTPLEAIVGRRAAKRAAGA